MSAFLLVAPKFLTLKTSPKTSPFACARRNEADPKICKAKNANTVLTSNCFRIFISFGPAPLRRNWYYLNPSGTRPGSKIAGICCPDPWSYQTEGVISGVPHRLITWGELWFAQLDVGKIQ